MKIEKVIRLMDGSIHTTKDSAERHILNMLSRGDDLKLCEELANKNALKVRDFLIENEVRVNQTMHLVRELNEVMSLKGF